MATLKIIREGWWRWIERGVRFDVTCTSTYVEDGNHKIVVDVPNAGEETEFLAALEKAGIDPLTIDLVVMTHHHPDHVGCLHLFPNAQYVSGGSRWKGSIHAYWEEEALAISDDVYVLKTPGHSGHDCSVIVNAPQGVTAVAGDLWVRSPSDPRIKVFLDREALEASRRRLIDLADFIIPGHGAMGPSSEAQWQIPE